MNPETVRLPWNPKKPLVGRWYWALFDESGVSYFPKIKGKVKKLYTVPNCQADCFYLESLEKEQDEQPPTY
jgi:hypothetical protein